MGGRRREGTQLVPFGLKSQPSGGAPADSAYAQRQPSALGSYRSNGGSRRLRATRWRLRQPPKRLDGYSHARPRNKVVDLDSRSGVLTASWLDSEGAGWCVGKLDTLPFMLAGENRRSPVFDFSSVEPHPCVRRLTQPSSLLQRGPQPRTNSNLDGARAV